MKSCGGYRVQGDTDGGDTDEGHGPLKSVTPGGTAREHQGARTPREHGPGAQPGRTDAREHGHTASTDAQGARTPRGGTAVWADAQGARPSWPKNAQICLRKFKN